MRWRALVRGWRLTAMGSLAPGTWMVGQLRWAAHGQDGGPYGWGKRASMAKGRRGGPYSDDGPRWAAG